MPFDEKPERKKSCYSHKGKHVDKKAKLYFQKFNKWNQQEPKQKTA